MNLQPPTPASPLSSERSLVLLLLVLLGAVLRVWQLGHQIPFDDEWHAIAFVLDHDFGYLLTHFTRLGANSIPQNLYLRFVFVTIGLSEWTLVAPSLAAGLLLVWLYPRWVAGRFGFAPALLSGALLAISPFLIFYSRFARPYALLLLLEFVAITQLDLWLRTGRRRHGAAAVALGTLAIWVHVTALPPLLAVWLVAILTGRRKVQPDADTGPGRRRVLLAGALMLAVGAMLTVPAILREANPARAADAPFTWQTLSVGLQLVCGTGALEAEILYAGLVVLGVALLARRWPRELALLGAAAAAAVLTVLVGHPLESEKGAVFARYSLPLFVLTPVAVGVAGTWLAGWVRSERLRALVAVVGLPTLLLALYFAGPLPYRQSRYASFTKQPALQYQYLELSGERSLPSPIWEGFPPLGRTQLHPFYARLRREGPGPAVIEYPFVIGDPFNRMYFAQLLHHRRVLAGYYDSGATWHDGFGLALARAGQPDPAENSRGYLMSYSTIDHVLGRWSGDPRLRFATVVDLAAPSQVRASGAEYVILHWNLPREFLRLDRAGQGAPDAQKYIARLRGKLASAFGAPIVEDEVLSVFRIQR